MIFLSSSPISKIAKCMGGIAALLAFSISSFASAHWSFQPVDKPSIPLVNDGSQVLNPLDFFILKKLEEAKIQPTKEASREVLIRRIYFSLPVCHRRLNKYRNLLKTLSLMPTSGWLTVFWIHHISANVGAVTGSMSHDMQTLKAMSSRRTGIIPMPTLTGTGSSAPLTKTCRTMHLLRSSWRPIFSRIPPKRILLLWVF